MKWIFEKKKKFTAPIYSQKRTNLSKLYDAIFGM